MVKRSQLNMAIPPDVLERLKERAGLEGVSVSALALRAIRQFLDASPEGLSIEQRLQRLEAQMRALKD